MEPVGKTSKRTKQEGVRTIRASYFLEYVGTAAKASDSGVRSHRLYLGTCGDHATGTL